MLDILVYHRPAEDITTAREVDRDAGRRGVTEVLANAQGVMRAAQRHVGAVCALLQFLLVSAAAGRAVNVDEVDYGKKTSAFQSAHDACPSWY